MLKLQNIKITDAYIEADSIPECSSECGHIKMNRVTTRNCCEKRDRFSGRYTRMAVNGLERVLSDFIAKKIRHIQLLMRFA